MKIIQGYVVKMKYLLAMSTLLVEAEVGSDGFGVQFCILSGNNPSVNEATARDIFYSF